MKVSDIQGKGQGCTDGTSGIFRVKFSEVQGEGQGYT